VTVSATASDADGAVAKVEFFDGATLVGTAASASYCFTWANVAAGSYSLGGINTDSNNRFKAFY